METKTYRVKGMHCASCASVIEKTFKKVDGVTAAAVNYGTEKATVSFDPKMVSPHALSGHLKPLGYSLEVPQTAAEMGMSESEHAAHLGLNQSKEEKLVELAQMRVQLWTALPIAAFAALVMAWDILAEYALAPAMGQVVKEFVHHLLPVLATYILFVVGKPYLLGLYRFFRYGVANMDTLIGLGTGAAFLYSFAISAFEDVLRPFINVDYQYYDVAIVVVTFIALGKYLETRSKLKTGDAIEKLLNLQAKTALVLRDGKELEISINDVVHGDRIVVKPGAQVPVDGTLADGHSYVDESLVTGEPMPVEKHFGDSVVAGTLNTTGSFTFIATKVGSETLLAQIIKMVEAAQGSKAPIQALADKISAVFVPVVLGIAFLSLGAWLVLGSQYLGFSQALSFGLVSFVGVLVIACPCALGLATPTAIIVGVGKGAKAGILIKDAATLEKLYAVDTVVVDKTGTITKGKPEVTKVSDEAMVQVLASLESKSEHPVAHAILQYAKARKIELLPVSDFEIIKGKGVRAVVGGIEYFAGNARLMSDLNHDTDSGAQIMLATKEKIVGSVTVADAIKPEAVEAVKNLHQLGIKTVMLTGDHKDTALAIAREVGIDDVVAEVLPDEKLEKIKSLQAAGHIVAMAGDGVNDAPALAQADVGIAMATGTDVAIASAGITLLGGDISKLVQAIKLSKLTMRGIRQNLFWAFAYNVVGIPLAAGAFYPFFGWVLNPVFAGFAMAMSSVSVVGNSLRIKAKHL